MGKGKGKASEATASAPPPKTDQLHGAGNDVKTFEKDWTVPLKFFQIDPIRYNPRPPISSPVFLTQLNEVTLAWTAVVEQTNTQACVTLVHKTAGIPNFGLDYALFLNNVQNPTTSAGGAANTKRLTTNILRALANTHPTQEKCSPKLFHAAMSQLGPYILMKTDDHEEVRSEPVLKIRINLSIDQSRFTVDEIMKRLIADEKQKGDGTGAERKGCGGVVGQEQENTYADTDDGTGVVGSILWHQVVTDDRKLCDVKIECADGSVRAHSVILAAFSKDFRDVLEKTGYNQRGWKLDWTNIRKDPVRNILRYVYTRRGLDPKVLNANPLEVVEASRLIGSPKQLLLPIELHLIKLMDEQNMGALYMAAKKQTMHVLENAIMNRLNNDVKRLPRMLNHRELAEYYRFTVPQPVTDTPSLDNRQQQQEIAAATSRQSQQQSCSGLDNRKSDDRNEEIVDAGAPFMRPMMTRLC